MKLTKLQLTKHHGLGNDFLIAVSPERSLDLTDAIAWCDRRRGIGADGLIELRPLSAKISESPAIWAMTLWNSDGSLAEVSGNGLRCVGQALLMREAATATDPSTGLAAAGSGSYLIRTAGGLRQVDVQADRRAGTDQVRVDMGAATETSDQSEQWADLGLVVTKQIGVSIGNPHLVALVEHPESQDLNTIGPIIEADFAQGINVHLIRVDNPTSITLRVWERGAGVTQACGSGACAAAWAAKQWGLVEDKVTVRMSGGYAEVEVGQESVFLTGPATFVGTVILDG